MRLNSEIYPPYPQPIIYGILSAQFITFIVVFKTKNYLKILLNLIRQTVICSLITLLCLYQFVMPRL